METPALDKCMSHRRSRSQQHIKAIMASLLAEMSSGHATPRATRGPQPTADRTIIYDLLDLRVEGVDLNIAGAYRLGDRPIVFLHGFGSTKEDYLDIIYHPELAGTPFIAYDAPGCGESLCSDLTKLSIQFLVKTAVAVLEHHGIQEFHLVGHSMGGLTALMLSKDIPGRVLSFANFEGKVAPEDCFLSRQLITHPSDDAQSFLNDFIERTRGLPYLSSALYAANVRHKVNPDTVRGIFASMVDLSDNTDLMSLFLSMPFPRMFMYGEQNSTLSYLKKLEMNSVRLAQVPHSAHWPRYSNPVAMWDHLIGFWNSQAY